MDKKKVMLVALTVALFIPKGELVAALTEEQRLADFHQLVNTIEKNYAPLQLKRESVGLDWESHVSEYEEIVRNAPSDKEFYHKIAGFMAGLQDAHVSIQLPSNLSARLGFVSDYVNGKVLIDVVDRKVLPKLLFPFERGDRVISIGGVSVNELMEELGKYRATGNPKSDKRLQVAKLTSRRQVSGDIVPQGQVSVEIQPRGENKIITNLVWVRSGSDLVDAPPVSIPTVIAHLPSISDFSLGRLGTFGLRHMGSSTPMFDLPEGTEVISQTPNVLMGTYGREGKKIGLLRIASYGVEPKVLIKEVAIALAYLEETVDVLVFDQTNNPGGNGLNVVAIGDLFVENPRADLLFAVRPTVSWMRRFEPAAHEAGITQSMAFMSAEEEMVFFQALRLRYSNFAEMFRNALEEGDFLTPPFDLLGKMGILLIPKELKVRFTKPVLLLINELCFSSGDMMPAFMKDNGRATLFGQKTVGAGGGVEPFGPLVYSDLDFRLTTSLIFRPNGELLENNGVKPHVEYSITEDDFMNGYKRYVEAFTREALNLIPMGIAL